MDGQAAVRVFVAEEQPLLREALLAVFDRFDDIEVVGTAANAIELLERAPRVRPDVVVLSDSLQGPSGPEIASEVMEQTPGSNILVLASGDEDASLSRFVEAGVRGYLTRKCRLDDVVLATRAVHRGETTIPRESLGPLLSSLVSRREERNRALRLLSRLTRRERQVLALLAAGMNNDAIARDLVISAQTARTHVQNVLGKLEVHSRLAAAAFALQEAVVEELALFGSAPGRESRGGGSGTERSRATHRW